MNYNHFKEFVKGRARFGADDDVVIAIRSALEVLGQRITAGQAEDLAAELPPELRRYLKQSPAAERFGRDEFAARVARKEGIGVSLAVNHINAVLSVVAEFASSKELQDTFDQLPKEIREFFIWSKKAA